MKITDSKPFSNWLPANAYFAILSQNPGWVEKCFQFQNHNWNISRFRQHLSRTFPLEKLARTVTNFHRQVQRLPKNVFTLFFSTCDGQQKKAPPISKRLNFREFHIFSKTGNTCKTFPFPNFFLFFKTLTTQVSSSATGPDSAV